MGLWMLSQGLNTVYWSDAPFGTPFPAKLYPCGPSKIDVRVQERGFIMLYYYVLYYYNNLYIILYLMSYIFYLICYISYAADLVVKSMRRGDPGVR